MKEYKCTCKICKFHRGEITPQGVNKLPRIASQLNKGKDNMKEENKTILEEIIELEKILIDNQMQFVVDRMLILNEAIEKAKVIRALRKNKEV